MAKSPTYYASDNVLEEFYLALASRDYHRVARCHLPKSDVHYARQAYKAYSGVEESLDRIERCMYLEGMIDAKDCFEPERTRDWEKNFKQFDEDYPEGV